MHKYIFLVRGLNDEPYAEFEKRMLALGRSIGLNHSPAGLRITVTAFAPPAISIIPFRKKRIAALSVTDPKGDIGSSIDSTPGLSGVYQVEEAVPVGYDKTWKDGDPTPGIGLLTLFRRRKGISYDVFLDRWHNSHTPLSLRLHPLWNYNRNVVGNRLTGSSEPWDGIVEEHFRTPSDLLNPFRFFGNPLKIGWNMMLVYTDTRSFLDYKTIEPFLVREYHLISHSGK